MMRNKRVPKRVLTLLFFALLFTGLCRYSFPGPTERGEREYIVKYRESVAGLSQAAPFDVVSEGELKSLLDADLLEWYEEDGEAVLLEVPSQKDGLDYDESLQWNLSVIHAQGAFERGALGQGVRVGVLDSGVNPHPDLGDRLLRGFNYMEDAADGKDTGDQYGHGTRVAGLIAGTGENGYLGAAPMAELIPLKITDGKKVRISAICRAVYGGIDDFGCDVLNMSLGISGEYQSLKEAMDYAEQQGVVVVSAVGNTGKTAAYYPAVYDTVVGVGAVDLDENVYYHSNHNDSVFLTAPGVDVRSTSSSGGYVLSSGTSFSVPQVSGAAAVLLGIDPALTPEEIRVLLAASAGDRGEEGFDEYYGYGILQIAEAVQLLSKEEAEAPEALCSFFPAGGPATRLLNHTDTPLNCTYLLAEYDEAGLCLGVTEYRLTIPAQETAELEVPAENVRYGQFVYESDTMRPLLDGRKAP